MPAQLKSLRSMQSAVTSGTSRNDQQPQQTRRSRFTSIFASASSSSSSNVGSYANSTDSSSSESASSTFSRHSASTSLSSIMTSEDHQAYPEDAMEDQEAPSNVHYEQLANQFLRYVKEVDTRRNLDNRRLLEPSSRMQPYDRKLPTREPRLPREFNGNSHDAVDQRWSPSGIKWRYARQGAQLAADASNERHDPSFERDAYIDAVAYYLRACPDQLDHGETLKLRCAAPWLAEQPHPAPQIAIARPTDRGRTFLADTVKYAVVVFVIYAHVLWSFLLSACRIGAYLEREYSIIQWLTTNGYGLVNAAVKHGVVFTAWVNAMNDGRFGHVVSWTMDSVLSGIEDGYGQGMDHIRQQDTRKEQPRT
ncbi:hypothetical protein TruAng_009319 [Truncatella angustata]|nr:hypothetical protein TruAng_009319 [Truncatella angustata]